MLANPLFYWVAAIVDTSCTPIYTSRTPIDTSRTTIASVRTPIVVGGAL
jgi:hypothetical protein